MIPKARFVKMLADIDAELTRLTEARRTIAALLEAAGDEGLPGDMDVDEVLHSRKRLGTVNDMTTEHALAISKTQRNERDKKFRAAMHKADYTQNSLAEKLGISSASLTRYRDKRPVPRKVADAVKTLIKFDGPWPGGIVE